MIVPIDDFSWTSANPLKCFALNRPLLPGERAFRLNMLDGETGSLDICEAAVTQMAEVLGWVPGERHQEALDSIDAYDNELTDTVDELRRAREGSPEIRQLVRDLDLAEAKLDDAISQFHAAEERLKEQDIYISSLEEDLER